MTGGGTAEQEPKGWLYSCFQAEWDLYSLALYWPFRCVRCFKMKKSRRTRLNEQECVYVEKSQDLTVDRLGG